MEILLRRKWDSWSVGKLAIKTDVNASDMLNIQCQLFSLNAEFMGEFQNNQKILINLISWEK